MKTYRAELHVHTVLSPCAEVEMIPPFIVQEALERGITLLAITDHNSTANIPAVIKAASGSALTILAGMELQTREEVHVLCLFDHYEQVQVLQDLVNHHLPPIKNDPEHFGEQFIVDETGDFLGREERLLLTSTDLTFEEAFSHVENLGGLFIPAHVNRKAFGLLYNLGFVPADLPIQALEISRQVQPEEALKSFPQIRGYPLIRSGDVHRLEEFLGVNEFILEAPTLSEIRLALRGEAGRSLTLLHS